MKYSIRKYLLVETNTALAFLDDLGSQVDHYEIEHKYGRKIVLDRGDCIVTLDMEMLGTGENSDYVHLGYLEVTDKEGDPHPACYRKGYAGELLQFVIDTADKHQVTLGLSAEGVPTEDIDTIYGIDMPDMQELANFYARYGFKETGRNSGQIYMQRDPR